MKKPYVQKLESFPTFYPKLMEYVRKHGRFSAEFLSKREMMGERARLYRYRISLSHFKPDDPLTKWVEQKMEVRYNEDEMVLEVINREIVISNMQIALEMAERGDYTSPSIDETADATSAVFVEIERNRRRHELEEQHEREQGTGSNETA